MGLRCKWLLGLALVLSSLWASAQTGPLDTPVSFEVHNTSLQQTLFVLADEAGFSFAYNSDLIPADSIINYTADNKTVREVLTDLLGPGISFSAMGDHIVLKPASETKRGKPAFAVNGQVLNASTGQVLEDVSVYSDVRLRYDITDPDGAYNLKLSEREPQQTIHISKVGYRDTMLVVSISEIYNLNVKLQPVELTPVDTGKSVEQLRIVQFFTNPRQRINAVNISHPLRRFGQVSFAPVLGTNWRMSGAITNMLSLNLIGGYNGGLKGLEIGVGFNIIRNDVYGLQISALGNTAGGDVKGVQLAAGYNLNLGSMSGFQASAGVNIQRRTFSGFQAAAGANYADTLYGVQASAGINIVRKLTSGVQVAPINYTKHLKGIQIGIINIADSAQGTPIGLLSIVRKGYKHLDVYADELTDVNLSFRTGVSYFHNIITVGASGPGTDPLWRIGYGVGSEFSFGKKKRGFSSFDVTVSYLNQGKDFITDLNILSTFNWDMGIRFKKHFGIFAGPSVKLYVSQYQNPTTGEPGLDIGWHNQYRVIDGDIVKNLWVGIRGGFRF